MYHIDGIMKKVARESESHSQEIGLNNQCQIINLLEWSSESPKLIGIFVEIIGKKTSLNRHHIWMDVIKSKNNAL